MSNLNKSPRRSKFDPVRAACIDALVSIEQGTAFDISLRNATLNKKFRPIDKRFFLQLVNGSTKMRRRLDYELNFYLSRPSTQLAINLKNILRLGLYQLRFTDRIPDAAAVNESVNLATAMCGKSQASLVNAVLRSSIREPEKVVFADKDKNSLKYLADYFSYPDYFVRYCLDEFGFNNTEKLLENYNKPPMVTYRVNNLKVNPDEVANILQENEIEFSYGKFLPEFLHIEGGGLPLEPELIETGKVYVQDESSGMAVRLLNPSPGSNVVDLTAAPGGKTTYIAIRMQNKGSVTAVEKSRERLELLVENGKRQNISIISPVRSDMFKFNGGPFDRVLVDPPCSGWGTAGKHSDLRWAKSQDDISKMNRIQMAMIKKASKLVKPGGVLVYSTCTIMREENDKVVEDFLRMNKDFEIESGKNYFHDSLLSDEGYVKTYPVFDKLDGAFCARLRKKVSV
jgi:16S rRNA (cytosine967-C5)-methyltransferase